MPAEKQFTKLIPRIYKWNVENIGLFFFIKAQQQIFPTITIDLAIKNYMRLTDLTFEEWDLDSIRSTYTRLQNEFYGKSNKRKEDLERILDATAKKNR